MNVTRDSIMENGLFCGTFGSRKTRKFLILRIDFTVKTPPFETGMPLTSFFAVKGFSVLFFGVSLLLLDRNLRNVEKSGFSVCKTALFCQKQGYLLRSRIPFEISSQKAKR